MYIPFLKTAMATISLQEISTGSTNGASGPTASLETTRTKLSPYYYPSDLGSSTKNHYVKFIVKQVIPASPTSTGFGAAVVSGAKDIARQITTFNYTPKTTGPVDVICLYMPDTLNASYNAAYDQLNLTNDLGKGIMGVQGITAVKDYLGDKNSGSARSIDAMTVGAAVGLASKAASAANFGGAGITDTFLQSLGYAINPQLQMIYRGLDFRQFQLSFMFTPASPEEAEMTNKIISTFKYHYSPDLIKSSDAVSGMFFVPPSLFNIQFMFDIDENQYLPRYGDCVLKDIDVNFAPNGFATHNDGSPVQTQLTLTFQEIEIVTKEKLRTGYNASAKDAIGSGTSGKVTGLR
jgi:hypothetical protein